MVKIVYTNFETTLNLNRVIGTFYCYNRQTANSNVWPRSFQQFWNSGKLNPQTHLDFCCYRHCALFDLKYMVEIVYNNFQTR